MRQKDSDIWKKALIIGCDPYLLTSTLFCPSKSAKRLDQLSFPDIYIYLVDNPSPYTGDFKSTNAYQYAVAGWVNDTKIWHLETKNMYVITGHVSNSNSDYQPCYFSGG